MAKRKNHDRWFSTTEAARLCGLSHMTVIRRFDVGDIKGFRVPGSRFRRIPRESLVEFARRHGLPLADLPDAEGDGGSGAEAEGGKHRALVVEDERRMADLLEKILAADGWEVRVARNGFDAGFLAGSFVPHLILLDIMLPGVDGREACRQMRSDKRLAGSRILAVTALRDERNVREIMEAGADGYLAKPFGIKELRDRIAALVGPGAAVSGFKLSPERPIK